MTYNNTGSYPYHDEPTHDYGSPVTAGRNTNAGVAEQRNVVDAADTVYMLNPTVTPFMAVLTNWGNAPATGAPKGLGLNKQVTTNFEFTDFEDSFNTRICTNNTATEGVAGSTTTFTVDGAGAASATIFTIDDLVVNMTTKEIMLVTAIPSATTVTVTRAIGSTVAAVASIDDEFRIIGNAATEGSGARNFNATRVTKSTNYTQIFKKTIALTNSEAETKKYGGDEHKRLRHKMAVELSYDIEDAFLFGEKNSIVAGNSIRRLTGGVREFLTKGAGYVQNQTGTLSSTDMNVFVREGMTYGEGTQKVLMAGGTVLGAINSILEGKLTTRMNETLWGITISDWVTSFGKVSIVLNPRLISSDSKTGMLLDMDSFTYRYLSNRDVKLQERVQANDTDGIIDQYIGEIGLERRNAAKNAYIKNVS